MKQYEQIYHMNKPKNRQNKKNQAIIYRCENSCGYLQINAIIKKWQLSYNDENCKSIICSTDNHAVFIYIAVIEDTCLLRSISLHCLYLNTDWQGYAIKR